MESCETCKFFRRDKNAGTYLMPGGTQSASGCCVRYPHPEMRFDVDGCGEHSPHDCGFRVVRNIKGALTRSAAVTLATARLLLLPETDCRVLGIEQWIENSQGLRLVEKAA